MICPLISAGKEISQVCLEESCAWYIKNFKACSTYVIAYQSAMDIKKQQDNKLA
jgi:hypothetical protein